MSQIADSDAIYDEERLLTQHQAALTLIQATLDNPQLITYNWLDLACGKGQIIANLENNLSANARGKVVYFGYDIEVNYAKNAEKKAESLGFKGSDVQIGELSSFTKLYSPEICFNFITLTNTIHEIDPANLSLLLFDCIARLCEDGCLFIYDMEKLPSLELGAVPWKRAEISEIISTFLKSLEVEDYSPTPSQWRHKSCNGWNVQIHRTHIKITDETLNEKKGFVIEATKKRIGEILERKFKECEASLKSLTKYGTETDEENNNKQTLLYDYWALSQAMEKI